MANRGGAVGMQAIRQGAFDRLAASLPGLRARANVGDAETRAEMLRNVERVEHEMETLLARGARISAGE